MADDEPFDNIKIEAEDEDEDVYEESGIYIFHNIPLPSMRVFFALVLQQAMMLICPSWSVIPNPPSLL